MKKREDSRMMDIKEKRNKNSKRKTEENSKVEREKKRKRKRIRLTGKKASMIMMKKVRFHE